MAAMRKPTKSTLPAKGVEVQVEVSDRLLFGLNGYWPQATHAAGMDPLPAIDSERGLSGRFLIGEFTLPILSGSSGDLLRASLVLTFTDGHRVRKPWSELSPSIKIGPHTTEVSDKPCCLGKSRLGR